MSTSPREVIEFARSKGAEFVDVKFLDFTGRWQHLTIPGTRLTEDLFESGIAFDGSSIRGWKNIDESDMLVVPDPETAFMDPFCCHVTLSLIGDIHDPITREPYSRDPRFVARKAERHLASTGIADRAYFGPEAEFFVFDDVRFAQDERSGFYRIDSREGFWNSGAEERPNLAHKPRFREGYFPVPPTDSLQDLRSEMVKNLVSCGLTCEVHHHEVATGGQGEIGLRYDTAVRMGDALVLFKYVVKNTARAFGRTATFMPKPLFGTAPACTFTYPSGGETGTYSAVPSTAV